MSVTPEHEALHRIFQDGQALFAHAMEILASALTTADTDTARDLAAFTESGLGSTPGLPIWRKLMATKPFPYISETRAKGQAEGEAKFILRALKRRGVVVDDASRKRIESCTDQETLGIWFDRSLDATTVEDLFKE